MKVSDTDRFWNHSVVTYPDNTITVDADAVNLPNKSQPHVVKQGETLPMLAHHYYKNFTPHASRLWWLIAEANSIIVPWTFDTDFEGKTINIPNYNEFRIKN